MAGRRSRAAEEDPAGQGRPSGAGSRDGLDGVESRARIEEHLDADKQPPLSFLGAPLNTATANRV